MMNVEIQKQDWSEAYGNYKDARQALMEHPEAKHLKIAARAYFHMQKGRGILDIYTAIKKAGLNEDGEPKLAIAPSNATKGFFRKRYNSEQRDYFYTRRDRWGKEKVHVTLPPDTFPALWPKELGKQYQVERGHISSPVPIVPPKILPRGAIGNYFTMWEVEHWTAEPPIDPILLQRISPNLFIVLGSWDTTPLERSILRGMYS